MNLSQHAETQEFLRELTELSRQYRIGIAGQVTLFIMEQDDFDRTYREEGDRIEFA